MIALCLLSSRDLREDYTNETLVLNCNGLLNVDNFALVAKTSGLKKIDYLKLSQVY